MNSLRRNQFSFKQFSRSNFDLITLKDKRFQKKEQKTYFFDKYGNGEKFLIQRIQILVLVYQVQILEITSPKSKK